MAKIYFIVFVSSYILLVLSNAINLSDESDSESEEDKQPLKCHCKRYENPVCGNDGKKYANSCFFKCAKKNNHKLEKTPCPPDETVWSSESNSASASHEIKSRDCACAKEEYDPLCGSDGTTYANKCLLKCSSKHNSRLSITKNGPCTRLSSRKGAHNQEKSCTCGQIRSSICGSDGKTYENKCLFHCEQIKQPNLRITSNRLCSIHGHRQHNSVEHGSDHKVPEGDKEVSFRPGSGNLEIISHRQLKRFIAPGKLSRFFNKYRREEDSLHNLDEPIARSIRQEQRPPGDVLTRQQIKEINACKCQKEYHPICSGNNITYANICHFICKQKNDKTVSEGSLGECAGYTRPNFEY